MDVYSDYGGFGGAGPEPILPFAVDTSTGDQVSLSFHDYQDNNQPGVIFLCVPCVLSVTLDDLKGLPPGVIGGDQLRILEASVQQALDWTLIGDDIDALNLLQEVVSNLIPPNSWLACDSSATDPAAGGDLLDLIQPPDPCVQIPVLIELAIGQLQGTEPAAAR